ncbi:MAG: hypothetical protein LBH65_00830 [Desulfovibrio sp.]|jgi:hypothetical protein|nr:hypothetical protein [Desulfovibrio sp.]
MSNIVQTAGTVALERVKADIVTGTLDKLNSPGGKSKRKDKLGGVLSTYEFSQDVLSAHYGVKGAIVNTKVGSVTK